MSTIIGLKAVADPEEYERWASDRYAPVVRSLLSTKGWHGMRASSVLGSNTAPP